ncbi:uncharacterized protein RCC_03362 [Ramularia collo-cygni]|uniref:Rhodopsin domain-containing protein n=1 Tax=Ramularia collo-cygni TaxID=112498 RepID=A0A2D3US42_9PEZI|nr:uncharacterized protein RCC_03362 [Ramularia collo-cygni]CZT17528.1 uncharacterized protein RCC_03362 [Ramularia collo-cygni]
MMYLHSPMHLTDDAAAAMAAMSEVQARAISQDDRGDEVLAIQIVMMVSAAVAVGLRFIARRIGPGKLWWDDWVILAALIPSLCGNITNLVALNFGLGKHVADVPGNGLKFLKTVVPVQMLYILGVGLAKGSVLLLYHRIFSLNSRTSRWVNIVAAIIIGWCITIEVVTVLQCQPLAAYWDTSIQGKCLNFRKLNLASAIGHIITTVLLISLPQPLIWRLNMSWRKKIAYSSICALGITTAVASGGRIVALDMVPLLDMRSDFTWHVVPALMWYSAEPCVGIICACLPCIGPIFRKNPFSSSVTCTRASSSVDDNSLQHIRTSEADDASMLRRLGATCEVSIYTAARENMSGRFDKETLNVSARRRGDGEGRIHIRNSTHIS